MQTWYVDTKELKASLGSVSRRQVRPMDSPFDTETAAEELAVLIRRRINSDPRIKWLDDSTVKISTPVVVPETFKQTTSGRRRRLIIALSAKLERDGWRRKSNQSVFIRDKG